MRKSFKSKYLMMLIIAIISCFTLSSCGNDEPNNSNLIGTWQNHAFIYHFDKNGKGYFQYSPSNGAYEVGEMKSYFKWSASSNILSITHDGSGTVSAGTSTYYYEVDANLLVLIDMDNGDTNSFTRR